MTFCFAPHVTMDAVYRDDHGNEHVKLVVGFAAEGPCVVENGEGKTIIVCTKPGAGPYGFKFMGLRERLIDPTGGMDYGEGDMVDSGGELDEPLPDVPPASG